MKTNNLPKIDERGDLRIEYETCQQAANNQTAGYWAFSGIFLGLSSILLASIVSIVLKPQHDIFTRLLVLTLTLGMWAIFFSLWRMLNRANHAQRVLYDRMICIEKTLGCHIQMRQQQDKSGQATHGRGKRWYGLILWVLAFFWLVTLIMIMF